MTIEEREQIEADIEADREREQIEAEIEAEREQIEREESFGFLVTAGI